MEEMRRKRTREIGAALILGLDCVSQPLKYYKACKMEKSSGCYYSLEHSWWVSRTTVKSCRHETRYNGWALLWAGFAQHVCTRTNRLQILRPFLQ
jgi:hypothetical protein